MLREMSARSAQTLSMLVKVVGRASRSVLGVGVGRVPSDMRRAAQEESLGANPYQKKILVRLSAPALLLISMGAERTETSAPDLFCDCPGPLWLPDGPSPCYCLR